MAPCLLLKFSSDELLLARITCCVCWFSEEKVWNTLQNYGFILADFSFDYITVIVSLGSFAIVSTIYQLKTENAFKVSLGCRLVSVLTLLLLILCMCS